MSIRFGTDGVRGRAYDEFSVADARRIGHAAATVLGAGRAILAHDSRESGDDLTAAAAQGLTDGGVAAEYLGVAPTPAVAFLSAADDVIGVMVSASHNPWHDNGIKIFAPGGRKLTDQQQQHMEAQLASSASDAAPDESPQPIAHRPLIDSRLGEYTRHLTGTVRPDALSGMRVVIDAANGAASAIAGPVLADLGADVVTVGTSPTGRNINDRCGSTHPEALQRLVMESGADAGVALDGDADRLIAVDHTGAIVNGDQLIAICAVDMQERGVLADSTVVVTVMTNLGFRLAMIDAGLAVHETAVGDRHVLAALEEHDWSLGGEQSGHLIFRRLSTTGDGLLSAVQMLDTVKRSGSTLHQLAAAAMTIFPQVLKNVPVAEKIPNVAQQLSDEIAQAEHDLGPQGRVLIRASGTEPLIRVMVEAATSEKAEQVATTLADAVQVRFQ